TTVSPTVWNNGTDQALTSRQALLQLQQSLNPPNTSPAVFPVTALQYVGIFSQENTTPSWSPDYDASQRGGSSVTTYSYKTNAAATTSINRDLSTVRVPAPTASASPMPPTFTRQNGSPAYWGEPVLKNRFPLSRLAWITYKGPSANLPTND